MNDLVLITNLSYRRNWQTLLEHLELHIQANRIVGLLGANGAGKTTLIRLIAGLSVAYRGTIEVEQVTSPLARKSIVSTNLAMIGSAKGATVTALASFWQGVYPDFDHNVFNQLATQLNLPLNPKLEALSKGNRAKVELALSWIIHRISKKQRNPTIHTGLGCFGVSPIGCAYMLRLSQRKPSRKRGFTPSQL